MNDESNIIRELRSIIPVRPLTLSQSYQLAEQQATAILSMVGLTRPHTTLDWVVELPRVEVQLGPRFKMDGFSGATTFAKGRYLVLVSKNESHARRRFTLAHEFKHVLDWTAAPVIHRQLGYGDAEKQGQQIELICNYFAACLLMPREWVRNAWYNGIRDVSALAGLFNVSEEAMDKRLRYFGYLDDEVRPVKTYFRLNSTAETITA